MPKLTIDQRDIEVPGGATLLDAAQKLGIDIPTLCFLKGCSPSTSCLACVVKVRNTGKLVPSCATVAIDGMEIESETDEIHQVRKSALELLLSDHLGDCLAPCYFACPARMDIPLMLRQIVAGDFEDAIETVKNDIALPAVLGRICPAPCEKTCRRRGADAEVAICRLKRFVADKDIEGEERHLPMRASDSGKHVAIVGAGPTGLAAAYYLLLRGHACAIFDENDQPGGRLHHETDQQTLPRDVLRADIEPILALGVELHTNSRVDDKASLDDLRRDFDAVLLASGASAIEQAEGWGLPLTKRGIQVRKGTYETDLEGTFAAGCAVRSKAMVVRSVADGKEAATAIDQYLCGKPVTGPPKPFNTRIGRLEPDELSQFMAGAESTLLDKPAAGPTAGYRPEEAIEQAARCLHCDCRALESCKLRKYAAIYEADPRHYEAGRRTFHQDLRHPDVIFEPGKCIDCGLCIEMARAGGESLGLAFIGRGFDVRVGVPFDGSTADALRKTAAQCVAACPTAALSLR
ncbi:MAG: FAD-dependent oxidoreductase [Thermoguttaceae bacterium]